MDNNYLPGLMVILVLLIEPSLCVLIQLVLGPSGVLQGIRPGKCYVEMSTVDPETITELSQVLQLLVLIDLVYLGLQSHYPKS